MKKIALPLFFVLLFAGPLSAQSLGFSEVINIIGDCSGGDRNDTVPAGKVWKFESVRTIDCNVYLSVDNSAFYQLNFFNDSSPISAPGSTSGPTMMQPVWLKSGAILQANCFTTDASDYYFFSRLEFEVDP